MCASTIASPVHARTLQQCDKQLCYGTKEEYGYLVFGFSCSLFPKVMTITTSGLVLQASRACVVACNLEHGHDMSRI